MQKHCNITEEKQKHFTEMCNNCKNKSKNNATIMGKSNVTLKKCKNKAMELQYCGKKATGPCKKQAKAKQNRSNETL